MEEEKQEWLLQLAMNERKAEKLRKLYAQRNVSLLYDLGAGPKRRQRRDIYAMPLVELKEWNSTLEGQYALVLDYAMRMSNSEHFAIGLRRFWQGNLVLQPIFIGIFVVSLAASRVADAFAPGLSDLLAFPAGLVMTMELFMVMSIFFINDWNTTGKRGARAELDQKRRTACAELTPWLESPWYNWGDRVPRQSRCDPQVRNRKQAT